MLFRFLLERGKLSRVGSSKVRSGEGPSRVGVGNPGSCNRFSRFRSGSCSLQLGSVNFDSGVRSSPVGYDFVAHSNLDGFGDSNMDFVPAGSDTSVVSFSEDDSFVVAYQSLFVVYLKVRLLGLDARRF